MRLWYMNQWKSELSMCSNSMIVRSWFLPITRGSWTCGNVGTACSVATGSALLSRVVIWWYIEGITCVVVAVAKIKLYAGSSVMSHK